MKDYKYVLYKNATKCSYYLCEAAIVVGVPVSTTREIVLFTAMIADLAISILRATKDLTEGGIRRKLVTLVNRCIFSKNEDTQRG